jgi:hypothetical protein
MPLQTVLFPKSKFTVETAKKWLKKQGYKTSYYGKEIQDEGRYLHARQRRPDKNKQYYTHTLPSGVKLVIMH